MVSMEHNSPKYMPSQALSGARTGLAMDSNFFFGHNEVFLAALSKFLT